MGAQRRNGRSQHRGEGTGVVRSRVAHRDRTVAVLAGLLRRRSLVRARDVVEALFLAVLTASTLLAAATVLSGAPAAADRAREHARAQLAAVVPATISLVGDSTWTVDGARDAGGTAAVDVRVTWTWNGAVRSRTEALSVVDLWRADVADPGTGTLQTALHVNDDGWPVRVVPSPLEAGFSAWLARGTAAAGLLALGALLRRLVIRLSVRGSARSWQRSFDRWQSGDHGSPHLG